SQNLQYYHDSTLSWCLPFLYKGCDGNDNNYKSPMDCMDYYSCSGGKNATGHCNGARICPTGSRCVMGPFGFGICCDNEVEEAFERELKPKCDKGKSLVRKHTNRGWKPLLGRKCSHKFCPEGTDCVEGTYLAHCCRSTKA
ncbi:Kunitz/Bovine pancreatic trypsin inhibitor domain protein, partial [Oesophagostomum dentatum]